MKFGAVVRQAVASILRNKGRSFLTTLGIIIGIGAVIAVMSIGAGVQQKIAAQITSLGTNIVTVRSQKPKTDDVPRGPGGWGGSSPGNGFGGFGIANLTPADFEAIKTVRGISAASPMVMVFGDIGLETGTEQTVSAPVTGVSGGYFGMQKLAVEYGSAFTDGDAAAVSPVIVLGADIAATVFDKGAVKDAVGRTVFIDDTPYKIVGVLKKQDAAMFVNAANSSVFVPYTAALKLSGRRKFASVAATASSPESVAGAEAAINSLLLARHKIANPKKADFVVITSKDLLRTTGNITDMVTRMLSGIAAISLLVGGIGIMNVMLVTVMERTREIGLRRAVGAKSSHIVVQFLTESVILTIIGGIFGLLAGYGLSHAAVGYTHVEPAITMRAVVLALSVSSAIGILFGMFPAIKAARMDPVEAIRYE